MFEVDKGVGPSIHGPAGSQNVKKRKQELLDCFTAKDLTSLNTEPKLRHCAVVYGYISKEKIITHNINNVKQCEDDASKQLDIALLSEGQNKHEWKQVTFHPGKHNTFITTGDNLPIHKAEKVVFGETVWALVPK